MLFFRNYEERVTFNKWQAAMRLRKHKVIYTVFVLWGISRGVLRVLGFLGRVVWVFC
ncbi:hypothetical protein Hanom_Chr16g01497871 [Helianthus anomalus]